MIDPRKVSIRRLSTGVPGLDTVLGGGLPEYSFNLVAGAPGTGKTTLVQQIMFANNAPERQALYFTVLGEPPLKMLRYQQQFDFFDLSRVSAGIRFVNLSQEALEQDLNAVLAAIVREVQASGPEIVVVDSFRTVARAAVGSREDSHHFQDFLQRLALYLASWQATTFLVGEYASAELQDNPVSTVADGIIWLEQSVERNASVRKLRIVKMRGQATQPGLHTMRISSAGVQVFPRIPPREPAAEPARPALRLPTGVPGLDELLDGGIPEGDLVLVAGPSGSGKSALAAQFIGAGVARDEPGVIAIFEERPSSYLERARSLGVDLPAMVSQQKVALVDLRSLDLSADEALLEIQGAVQRLGARCLVVDSLSGFELALAPTFRDDFRESLYRMIGALAGDRLTVCLTIEIAESFTSPQFSPQLVSFLADDVILQRHVELDGQIRKVLTVSKMRRSRHSIDLHTYEITDRGLVVGAALRGYHGIMTGVPWRLQAGASGEAGGDG
jgi:circadian clock protein KaiC